MVNGSAAKPAYAVIVTGAPRCGTSVAVRTVAGCGYDTISPAFRPEHRRIVQHNMAGFYDATLSEIRRVEPGQVVKVFGGGLVLLPRKLKKRLVICWRPSWEAIASMRKVAKDDRLRGKVIGLFASQMFWLNTVAALRYAKVHKTEHIVFCPFGTQEYVAAEMSKLRSFVEAR